MSDWFSLKSRYTLVATDLLLIIIFVTDQLHSWLDDDNSSIESDQALENSGHSGHWQHRYLRQYNTGGDGQTLIPKIFI